MGLEELGNVCIHFLPQLFHLSLHLLALLLHLGILYLSLLPLLLERCIEVMQLSSLTGRR